ncbi:MAG: hypothetical protein IJO29_00485 [Oscillospiraceae bacterium]|nr:hypothetical protein [Oscillospiraceae bacterium]
MLKLLKYEFIKISNAVLIVLGAVTLLEATYGIGAVIMKFNSIDNYNGSYADYYDSSEYILYSIGSQMYTFSMVLLLIAVFSATIFVVIFSLVTMNNDFCKKQGYNVFLTPNSSYAILGAKYITSFVIFSLYGVIAFLLIIADINISSWLYDEDLIMIFEDIIWPLLEETGIDFLGYFLAITSQLIYYIFLAGFTLIISQTVLKVSGGAKVIIQFVVFGFMNTATTFILGFVLAFLSNNAGPLDSHENFEEIMGSLCYVSTFVYLAISLGFYLISAKLIEKRLSL